MQLSDFTLGHRRRTDPASDAFLFSQLFHVKLLLNYPNLSRQAVKVTGDACHPERSRGI
jgi:hypothetical protein